MDIGERNGVESGRKYEKNDESSEKTQAGQ